MSRNAPAVASASADLSVRAVVPTCNAVEVIDLTEGGPRLGQRRPRRETKTQALDKIRAAKKLAAIDASQLTSATVAEVEKGQYCNMAEVPLGPQCA